jgi:hypothetical protein
MSLTVVEFLLEPLPQLIALLVVAFVGTVFAIRLRRTAPSASRLVIAGFLALLVGPIGSYAVRIYSYASFDRWQDASVHGQHIAELYAVLHFVNVAGVILIAAAVFANRVSVCDAV